MIAVGVEPTASRLKVVRSTTELRDRNEELNIAKAIQKVLYRKNINSQYNIEKKTKKNEKK